MVSIAPSSDPEYIIKPQRFLTEKEENQMTKKKKQLNAEGLRAAMMCAVLAERYMQVTEGSTYMLSPVALSEKLYRAHYHCNLRLKEMVDGPIHQCLHDIGGIVRHFNTETREFSECFWPRFADGR